MNNLYQTMNMQNMISQFNQFRQGFNGDPKQIVQQMLNSGQVTQEQFNQIAQTANMLRNMIK